MAAAKKKTSRSKTQKPAVETVKKTTAPLKKIKVLLVEDIDSMRQFLKITLEETGEILVQSMAANIWEARMEVDRRKPDVVLLDEVLPGESSLDFLAELIQRKIPTLLLTGMEAPTHGLPPGALGRLMKPGWKSPDPERSLLIQAIQDAAKPH